MPTSSPLRLPVRLALYGGGAIAVMAVAALMKYLLSRLAEYVIYPIPLLGGLLQSLELAELSNLLVFAILGLGLGMLTRLLPAQWGQRLSAALLIVLVPLIFMISTQVRYERWVQTVAEQEQLGRAEAIALTNAYLDDRIQSQGWWGFYRYTARYTTIPTSQAEMQRAMGIDARVQAQFAKVTGMGTPIVANLMTLCSWGLRLFYFAIAAIVTISHFQEGLKPPVPASKRILTTPAPPTERSPCPAVASRSPNTQPQAATPKASKTAKPPTPKTRAKAKVSPKTPRKTQAGGRSQGRPLTTEVSRSSPSPTTASPPRSPQSSQDPVADPAKFPSPPRSESPTCPD